MHIALLTDINSAEKEIADKSMILFRESLEKLEYTYDIIQWPTMKKYFLQHYHRFDLAVPVIHGGYGEGGQITAVLELLGIPYLFSDSSVHSLCRNKYASNLIVQDMGIAIPQTYHCISSRDRLIIPFSGPYFVKPNANGSSLDAGVFNTIQEAQALIDKILHYDTVLIQQKITGRELTVSLSGSGKPTVLGIMEVITEKEFFDFDAKYSLDHTKEVFPQLDKKTKEDIERVACNIYTHLGVQDIGRIDLFLSDQLYFIEINTIPGMTPTSFLPQCVKAYGYSGFEVFLDELIQNKISIYHRKDM